MELTYYRHGQAGNHPTGEKVMGDIADMIIDGFLDSETGELIDGDAPGYPRTIDGDYRPGPKPHRCLKCRKGFRTQHGLSDHNRDKHPQRAITTPEKS